MELARKLILLPKNWEGSDFLQTIKQKELGMKKVFVLAALVVAVICCFVACKSPAEKCAEGDLKACEEVGRNASKAADAIMRGAGF